MILTRGYLLVIKEGLFKKRKIYVADGLNEKEKKFDKMVDELKNEYRRKQCNVTFYIYKIIEGDKILQEMFSLSRGDVK